MRNALLFFVSAALLAGCAASQTTPTPTLPPPAAEGMSAQNKSAAEREVAEALRRFGRMWEDENMDTFDALVANDPEMIIIGTDTAEYIIGFDAFREAREQQFASFENVEYNVDEQTIGVAESGNVAWFTQRFDLFLLAQKNPVSLEDIRVTGVLEKRDGRWQIVQLHTSVPVAGQAAEY